MTQKFRDPEKQPPVDYKFIQQMPPGECAYCDREREAGNSFFPPHTARWRCQSGRYNHCTCDGCF